MMHFAWLALALVPGLAWADDKAPKGGTKVASFTLRDYRGAESSLEQFAAKKAVVLAFVGCECPVAKLYGPRLAKLAKDYEAKGVQFLGIDANQQDGVSQIARFAKDAGIEFPILKDVNNVLADQLGSRAHHGSCSSWTPSGRSAIEAESTINTTSAFRGRRRRRTTFPRHSMNCWRANRQQADDTGSGLFHRSRSQAGRHGNGDLRQGCRPDF